MGDPSASIRSGVMGLLVGGIGRGLLALVGRGDRRGSR